MHEINVSVDALHTMFDALNEKYFDGTLEPPVITIQSNGKNKNSLGWCTVQRVWKEKDGEKSKIEINVSAEYLSRPLINIACTLQHENCHLFCLQNGIKDTSNNFVYHNKRFKKEAEARGLIIEEAKTIGHSVTSPSNEFTEFINSLNIPEEAFSMYRVSVIKAKSVNTRKKKPKVEWHCGCGTVIKSKKTELNIICGECKENFKKVIHDSNDNDDEESEDD